MTAAKWAKAAKVALALALAARVGGAQRAVDWPAYGGDALGSRFSPLADISRENVGKLRLAWTYHTGEKPPAEGRMSLEATPIVVDGTLFFSTPRGKVIALDAATGAERWRFDSEVDEKVRFGDHASRGVSTWLDSTAARGAPCRRTIFFASIDARLFALDARTGTRCVRFGGGGVVDLRTGLRNPPFETAEYEETSPPAVINSLVVVGSAVADNNRIDAASGEVRAFDARTGALRWTWEPVAQDARDPAYETWQGPNAHRTGAANAWSVLAADPARDLVFVPTGSASPDYFGGERKGENRYANSIVALRASTGQMAWHFQVVHHDLWDYDNASPPLLATLHVNGRDVPAVIQANKNGMVYVLDRETGEPVFPVEERSVPASDVPGESAWPTQPFTTFLPPLVPHRLTNDDAWGITDSDRAACRAQIAALRNDGIYTPPSVGGSLVVPSNIGGAHWGGVAYDPRSLLLLVPVNRLATAIELIPRAATTDADVGRRWSDSLHRAHPMAELTSMRGTPYVLRREILLSASRLPCTPPPWGELAAVHLGTGAIAWRVPLGGTVLLSTSAGPPVAAANVRPIAGSPNLGGPIVTAGGLAFIGATVDRKLRAFDVRTGEEAWTGDLPAGAKATPMTYRAGDGRQFVVVAAGGDNDVFGTGDAIVAFALPAVQKAAPPDPNFLSAPCPQTDSVCAPPAVPREFRGVWVATVSNIDWPSKPELPPKTAKAELIAILDRAAAMGLNAVIFQVRPAGDALYASEIEPWSEYLTGRQGRAPAPWWDPLAFALKEAHERGLELHAWFNPYRAKHPSAKGPLSAKHLARQRPELVKQYGTHLWMDPGEPAVRARTLRVVLDVVKRYDIDGVHLDDYFYPYKERRTNGSTEFPDDPSWKRYQKSGGTLERDDWRRRNVDRLIDTLHKAIAKAKPWVKFGISPFGIWRPGNPETAVVRFDAYAELYADSRKWLQEGWVDYLAPQLYWTIDAEGRRFPDLLRWWAAPEQNAHRRHLWPGLYASRVQGADIRESARAAANVWPRGEILAQVETTRVVPTASGEIHFSMKVFAEDRDSVGTALERGLYAERALVPASPWKGADTQRAPIVSVRKEKGGAEVLQLAPPEKKVVVRWWLVQLRYDNGWETRVLDGALRTWPLRELIRNPFLRPNVIAVTAVDRTGSASTPVAVVLRESER